MVQIDIAAGSRYPVNRKKVRGHILSVLAKHHVDNAEVSVSFVGARRMTWLNEHLMKHQGVTDVLSFPQHDPEQPTPEFIDISELQKTDEQEAAEKAAGEKIPLFDLGDIVVCYPVAVQEAGKKGKMVDDHINFLVEHGVMHLLGFHHD